MIYMFYITTIIINTIYTILSSISIDNIYIIYIKPIGLKPTLFCDANLCNKMAAIVL